MRYLVIGLLVLLGFGCSVLDSGDRDELRHRIGMLPPDNQEILRELAMNAKALQWLGLKNRADQMGKIQCRDNSSGQWSGWYDRPDKVYTVADMIRCLSKADPRTYIGCAEEFAGWVLEHAHDELAAVLRPGTVIQCMYVWDFRYDPKEVPPELVDPKAVVVDDFIDAMIAAPAPPPGWSFPELIPFLCPLGAGPGWGCPGTPTDPTGSQPGDHP